MDLTFFDVVFDVVLVLSKYVMVLFFFVLLNDSIGLKSVGILFNFVHFFVAQQQSHVLYLV